MNGRETRAKAAKVVSRSAKSWPWIWATGATSAALADRLVQVHPAPGERVAELEQVLLDGDAGRVVEHVEDLIDLDRLGPRGRDRHRRSGLEALARVAAVDLEVLEPECGAGADDHRGVLRQRVDVLVELHVQLGNLGRALPGRVVRAGGVVHRLRLDRLDLADADAADPDFVSGHQGVGVGQLGRELVGGDERQALVGLVGEEDRHDHDEHGHRPDEGRAGGEAAHAPAPHAPPPSRNWRNICAWFIETAWSSGARLSSFWSLWFSSGVVVPLREPSGVGVVGAGFGSSCGIRSWMFGTWTCGS